MSMPCGLDGKTLKYHWNWQEQRLIQLLQGSRLRKPSVTRVSGCFAEEDHLHWPARLGHALAG